ncbi:MAG: GNAT family N-acetyltransferase [Flavobacteriaceae bacterium]|nr:GNAT family N-acetyltransferase [Flavobacteriaceae bacterium]
MEYHSDRFEDYSLMVFQNEKLIALLPANIKDGVVSSHLGLSYGGLLLKAEAKFKLVAKAFQAILKHLHDQELHVLNVKMLPKIYVSFPSDELDYMSFILKADLYRTDLSVSINLCLKNKFSRDRKAGIKRGKANKLEVKLEDNFEAFWNELLIAKLNKKHGAKPVHSLDEIKLLKERFPEKIKQFNVYQDDKIVAGTTIFETKMVAHSQYIASNKDKNISGALDFLHEHVIAYYQKKSKLYFDFGISNENGGMNINEGLLYWKEGFGARAVMHQFYTFQTKNYNLLNSVFI